jgi:hypothetical protein
MTQLIRIINHINNLNNDDEILEYLYTFKYLNKIFNKSDESIQIDFIKQLLIKIKSKDTFKDSLPLLKMQNIYTINKLLEWGIDYNDYNLCYFVLNHKDKNIYITINEYYEYENRTNNKDISLLFSQFRMKEAYNMELHSDNSSDTYSDSYYSSSDSSTESDSFFSSTNSTSSYSDDSDDSDDHIDDNINTRTIEDID